mgnify:CR=1 FL=1
MTAKRTQTIETISIHAPREGGDDVCQRMRIVPKISIHAPREGGDGGLCIAGFLLFYFNPRPPRGGRRKGGRIMLKSFDISIHAPREGGDKLADPRMDVSMVFQSTPPARGATVYHDRRGKARDYISIHAPREGGDPT